MTKSTAALTATSLLCFGLIGCGIDPEYRYTVTGELGATGEGLENPEVVVRRSFYEDGKSTREEIASAKVKNGQIELEGEIREPTVVSIYLIDGERTKDSVQAVIEPHATIKLVDLGKNKGMIADGDGKHGQLVASWMMSDDFVTSLHEYGDSLTAWQAEQEAKKQAEEAAAADADGPVEASETTAAADEATDEAPDDEAQVAATATETVDDSSTDETTDSAPETPPALASTDDDAPANACEGEVAEAAASEEEIEKPERYVLYEKVIGIQNDSLDELARSSTDPTDALLAMELGGLRSVQEGVSRLDELAGLLSDDVVAARIAPRRDGLVAHLKRVDADKSLSPGKFAPEFALADFEGESVALTDVLQDNEVVLVDFWASWCGPCIATFPDLKRMYGEYRDDGFEVVAITIDSTREDWEEATEEHELPWLNLEELQIDGSRGPVYNSYGVTFIPKGYILNKDACIIGKDMSTEELDKLLAAQFADSGIPSADEEASSDPTETLDDQIGS